MHTAKQSLKLYEKILKSFNNQLFFTKKGEFVLSYKHTMHLFTVA